MGDTFKINTSFQPASGGEVVGNLIRTGAEDTHAEETVLQKAKEAPKKLRAFFRPAGVNSDVTTWQAKQQLAYSKMSSDIYVMMSKMGALQAQDVPLHQQIQLLDVASNAGLMTNFDYPNWRSDQAQHNVLMDEDTGGLKENWRYGVEGYAKAIFSSMFEDFESLATPPMLDAADKMLTPDSMWLGGLERGFRDAEAEMRQTGKPHAAATTELGGFVRGAGQQLNKQFPGLQGATGYDAVKAGFDYVTTGTKLMMKEVFGKDISRNDAKNLAFNMMYFPLMAVGLMGAPIGAIGSGAIDQETQDQFAELVMGFSGPAVDVMGSPSSLLMTPAGKGVMEGLGKIGGKALRGFGEVSGKLATKGVKFLDSAAEASAQASRSGLGGMRGVANAVKGEAAAIGGGALKAGLGVADKMAGFKERLMKEFVFEYGLNKIAKEAELYSTTGAGAKSGEMTADIAAMHMRYPSMIQRGLHNKVDQLIKISGEGAVGSADLMKPGQIVMGGNTVRPTHLTTAVSDSEMRLMKGTYSEQREIDRKLLKNATGGKLAEAQGLPKNPTGNILDVMQRQILPEKLPGFMGPEGPIKGITVNTEVQARDLLAEQFGIVPHSKESLNFHKTVLKAREAYRQAYKEAEATSRAGRFIQKKFEKGLFGKGGVGSRRLTKASPLAQANLKSAMDDLHMAVDSIAWKRSADHLLDKEVFRTVPVEGLTREARAAAIERVGEGWMEMNPADFPPGLASALQLKAGEAAVMVPREAGGYFRNLRTALGEAEKTWHDANLDKVFNLVKHAMVANPSTQMTAIALDDTTRAFMFSKNPTKFLQTFKDSKEALLAYKTGTRGATITLKSGEKVSAAWVSRMAEEYGLLGGTLTKGGVRHSTILSSGLMDRYTWMSSLGFEQRAMNHEKLLRTASFLDALEGTTEDHVVKAVVASNKVHPVYSEITGSMRRLNYMPFANFALKMTPELVEQFLKNPGIGAQVLKGVARGRDPREENLWQGNRPEVTLTEWQDARGFKHQLRFELPVPQAVAAEFLGDPVGFLQRQVGSPITEALEMATGNIPMGTDVRQGRDVEHKATAMGAFVKAVITDTLFRGNAPVNAMADFSNLWRNPDLSEQEFNQKVMRLSKYLGIRFDINFATRNRLRKHKEFMARIEALNQIAQKRNLHDTIENNVSTRVQPYTEASDNL